MILINKYVFSIIFAFFCIPSFNFVFAEELVPNNLIANNVTVTSVEIYSNNGNTFEPGDLVSFTINIKPFNVTNRNIVLTTSDSDIAKVEDTYYVRALKNGEVDVKVTTIDGNYSSTYKIYIKTKLKELTIDSLNPQSIYLGEEYQFKPKFFPDTTTNKNVNWAVGNVELATIGINGVINPKKTGTTYVQVFSEDWKFTSKVDINIKVRPIVSEIILNSQNLSLALGEKFQMNVRLLPDDASNKLSWVSENSSVATVDSNGLILAVNNGATRIKVTALSGGKVEYINIIVKTPLKGINLDRASVELSKNNSLKISPSFDPFGATNKSIIWTSQDPAIAKVDSVGNITALKDGETVIKARSVDGGFERVVKVTVFTPLTRITAKNSNINLIVNENIGLSVEFYPNDATNKNLIWEVSDSSVVNLGSDGKITARKPGNALVTATSVDGNLKTNFYIFVSPKLVTGIELGQNKIVLIPRQTYKLQTTIIPNDATNQNVNWISSNKNIATVDDKGLITALNNGVVKISVITVDGSRTANVTIIVDSDIATVPVSEISIQNLINIKINDEIILTPKISPENATNKEVEWRSSDSDIATVDHSGKVKGVSAGTTIIRVKSIDGNYFAESTINVIGLREVSVSEIKINQDIVVLEKNNTLQLYAKIYPEDASIKLITWYSSNPNIVEVDQTGKIKAVGLGNAEIKAVTASGSKESRIKVSIVGDKTPPDQPLADDIFDNFKYVSVYTDPYANVTFGNATTGKYYGTIKADKTGYARLNIGLQTANHEIMIFAGDESGNLSQPIYKKVIDATPPIKPIVYSISSTSTKLGGKTERLAKVVVKIGNKTYTTTAKSDGTFSVYIPRQKKGTKIAVSAADSSGNMSISTLITAK